MIVFIVIGLVIAASVFNTADCGGNTTCSNFTGVTRSVMIYVVPVGAIGALYLIAKTTDLI